MEPLEPLSKSELGATTNLEGLPEENPVVS
jgi:hypothetical protein